MKQVRQKRSKTDYRSIRVNTIIMIVMFGVMMILASNTHAQLNDDFQAYQQIANSVVNALQQGDLATVDNSIEELLEKDETLKKSIDYALRKIRATMITGNPYEGTQSSLDETTTLGRNSSLSRLYGAIYAILWVHAVETSDPDAESVRQGAIETLTDAVSQSQQVVENMTPLLQYVDALEALPPILLIDVPENLSFSSTDNVQIRATIENEGDAPAKDVAVFIENENESGEVNVQSARVGVIPGKTKVVHTFYVEVPEDASSMIFTVRVEASNALGDSTITTINFTTP